MLPVLALVGRPNVGKSTLFNKLTKSRDALVADLPGLTRDRQYGDGKLGDFPCIVVDTGGLSETLDTTLQAGGALHAESIDFEMVAQTALAIDESDLVLFMVDGRAGCTPADEQLARELRRREAKVLLVVNKIDGIGEDQAAVEFFSLGMGEPVGISASHNRGLLSLLESVGEALPIELVNEAKPEDGPRRGDRGVLEIAFVGRPNVGKSTLVNRLCGEERVIAFDKPGTTRDTIHISFSRAGKDYSLVDTAGIRRRGKVNETVEKFSIIKTLQAIEQANVCVYLMDANDSITDQDLHLLGYIIDKGRALVVAINKWDSVSTEEREKVREDLQRRVEFLKFTKMHFISALKGSGVGDLFKSINRAYASAFMDLSTPQLTRMLEVAVESHQPPMVNGRRIKLRFAHQGGVNPPIIIIHGNQTSKMPKDYQRYITNYFQKALRLFGTPLKVQYRQGENPYSGKAGTSKPRTREEAIRARSNKSGSDKPR